MKTTTENDAQNRLRRELLERFFVRFHMTLILGSVVLVGVVSSKLLLEAGVTSMLVRYPLAVTVSYLAFFGCIRVWLWYVSKPRQWDLTPDAGDVIDGLSNANDFGGGSGGGGGHFSFGGGGDFGGGGATDGWAGADVAPVARAVAVAPPKPSGGGSSGGSSGWSFDFDFDDGIVLLVFGLLVLIVFGAGVYLVYQAPIILTEAAFQAVLASGLVKASRRLESGGWAGSILRATWIPFAVVLAMALVFGTVAHVYCPDAAKIADVLREPKSE